MLTKDSLSSLVRSRLFTGIILGIGIMLILVCVFEAGVALGYHEAVFSSRWGANYEQNFGGGGMPGEMGLPDGHEPQPHGTTGEIISISGSTLVIQDTGRQEQKVIMDGDTVIRNQENTISASALAVGNYAVVVGDPDDQGNLDAKLIRIIPAPLAGAAAPASSTPY
jgi:hypothetical protein